MERGLVETIEKDGIAPPNWPFGKPWPGDAHHATKAAAISRRDVLGTALFGESYDSGSADHKKCVAKYAAARQIHTEETLVEAKGTPIFTKKGNSGFGDSIFFEGAPIALDTMRVPAAAPVPIP